MVDWSTHTTVEINRLQGMKEKELLARIVYLLDKLVNNSEAQIFSNKFQSATLKDIEKAVRRK